MRAWAILLGGLIVWTVHFFTLYAIASILLTTMLARWLVAGATAVCLACDALLLASALRSPGDGPLDHFERWLRMLGALVAAISLVAVLWQGLPALLA